MTKIIQKNTNFFNKNIVIFKVSIVATKTIKKTYLTVKTIEQF